MNIYFDEPLFKRVLEIIKDGYDCVDIYCDLERINQAEANVHSYTGVFEARQLDQKLLGKYDTIDKMLKIANTMQTNPLLRSSSQNRPTCSEEETVISHLEQDRCGILCDTAMKKGLVQSIEHCIKDVK